MYYCTNCPHYNFALYKITYSNRIHFERINPSFNYIDPHLEEQLFHKLELKLSLCSNCNSAGEDILIQQNEHNNTFVNAENKSKSNCKTICSTCRSGKVVSVSLCNKNLNIIVPNKNLFGKHATQILAQSKLMKPNLNYYEIYYCGYCGCISDDLIRFQPRYEDELSPRTIEKKYIIDKEEYNLENNINNDVQNEVNEYDDFEN
jgi:hypothetical protein